MLPTKAGASAALSQRACISYTALLIYCADYYCSRSVAISADIRSHFSWNKTSVAMMGFRRRFLSAGYFKGATFREWSEGDRKM